MRCEKIDSQAYYMTLELSNDPVFDSWAYPFSQEMNNTKGNKNTPPPHCRSAHFQQRNCNKFTVPINYIQGISCKSDQNNFALCIRLAGLCHDRGLSKLFLKRFSFLVYQPIN